MPGPALLNTSADGSKSYWSNIAAQLLGGTFVAVQLMPKHVTMLFGSYCMIASYLQVVRRIPKRVLKQVEALEASEDKANGVNGHHA